MRIIFIGIFFMSTLFAELKVGDSFPSLTLIDQFDEKMEISKEGEHKLLFSFEKDVSVGIQEFLVKQDENFLKNNNLLYISDISSLPIFLVNLFVLPKLKKFDFRVALIYDEKEEPLISYEEGKTTLVILNNNKVIAIEFVALKELGSNTNPK